MRNGRSSSTDIARMDSRLMLFSHFHGYFDLLFAAVSSYSVVFISVERWFSIWKPFDKVKWVTFKTTIIAVISYISVSMITCSWFPVTLHYNPNEQKPGERCRLKRPMLYKIFGSISVVFTYIGKGQQRARLSRLSKRMSFVLQRHSSFSAYSIFSLFIGFMLDSRHLFNVRWRQRAVPVSMQRWARHQRASDNGNDTSIEI